MARPGIVLIAVAAWLAGPAGAQEETPDLSFLEYLGSWQEGDEEWLLVVGMDEDIETDGEAPEKDEETDEKDDE